MSVLEALGFVYLICAVIIVGVFAYCMGHGTPAWLAQDDPNDDDQP